MSRVSETGCCSITFSAVSWCGWLWPGAKAIWLSTRRPGRRAGQTRWVPLGSVDAISLAMAHTAAARVMGQVAMGTAADRKAAVEGAKVVAARERVTLAQRVADWERLHLVHRRVRSGSTRPRA